MNDRMKIYNMGRNVPDDAKKTIGAGKIKGFTDINPMWRIQMLTEMFGPCGIGWYIDDVKYWLEKGDDGKTAAFCELNLYFKTDDGWSKPIKGIGGSMFVNIFGGKQETSDEAYKMAYTDAISVACKALGIGADVYWAAGRTKYSLLEEKKPAEPVICPKCGQKLKPVIKGSKRSYTAEEYMQAFGMCSECYIAEYAAKKNAGELK